MTTDLEAFHEFEKNGWNGTANVYDQYFGHHTIAYCEPLLIAADVVAGTQVLDLACGPGYVAEAARQRGAVASGVDFAANMVQQAKELHPHCQFQIGDVEALNFGENQYDAVVMGFGMLHLARPEAAAREALRVLKPGGRFAFSVWGEPTQICVGTGIVLAAMNKHADLNLGLPEGPPMFRFGDHKEAEALLEGAGFESVTVQTHENAWVFDKAEALYWTFKKAGVRAGIALRAQPPEVEQAILEEVETVAERFRVNDQYQFPMGAVITSGIKTAAK